MCETCNGVDDDRNGYVDDLESCWTAIYRYRDASNESRCYGTSTFAPSACGGYAGEFGGPVFYLYAPSVGPSVPGVVSLIAFDRAQDHILARGDRSGDLNALRTAGYSERGVLGYIWSNTSSPPSGTYVRQFSANTSFVRDLRRYSRSGVHLFANNPAETAPGWSFEGTQGYVWGSRW